MTDDDDCLDYLMKQPHIMPRLNDRILKDEDSVFLDYTGESLPSLKLEHFGALNRQVNQFGHPKTTLTKIHPILTTYPPTVDRC